MSFNCVRLALFGDRRHREPANHILGDLLGAERVKLVSARELKLLLGTCQRSLETSLEKAAGLNHDRASGATVRMAIGQPEELRRFRLLSS
jgi:hypothetical protein